MVYAIDAVELADLLAKPDVDLIDVRDLDEWESGHLTGSRVLPLEMFRADPEAFLESGKTLVFVCAKGVRSMAAAKLAERFGYARVYTLSDGVKGWISQGLPVRTIARAA